MVKLSELKRSAQVWADLEDRDPGFRAEWQRLALARAVAAEVSAYREQQGLTMKQLAEKLGTNAPQVARLESGDHEPEMRTLRLLAERLGMSFSVAVGPTGTGAFTSPFRVMKGATVDVLELPSGVTVQIGRRGPVKKRISA